MSLGSGIYPASVTPFDEKGRVDLLSLARLFAWFEHTGCAGVVLAGTNGEGPALSAGEKRDLVRGARGFAGSLTLILGAATSSAEEAIWLSRRAEDAGAAAVLVMPPPFYRDLGPDELTTWFREILDGAAVPVIVYNFPKKSGSVVTAETVRRLADHPNLAGLKDSSGEEGNLSDFKEALSGRSLPMFVGDETLLIRALEAGWTGSISGAANVVAPWLVQVLREKGGPKADLLEPVLRQIRSSPQPATHKAWLHREGILASPLVRRPLVTAEFPTALRELVGEKLGDPFGI